MPSIWEEYPETQHPIEFKLLDNLISNRRYRLFAYPFLEQPRQLSLNREDPNLFKTISRDFCILRSPGHVSWQTKKAQRKLHLSIFHADTVRIPLVDLKAKFQIHRRDYSNASYLNRYYHEGLTRTAVEKFFRDRFGLAVPLDMESASDQWIPAVVQYTVEIEQNVWQDRLAVIFDGNVGMSQQSMKQRMNGWGEMLHPKLVGRLYLEIWREKWTKGKGGSHFLEGRSAIAATYISPAATNAQLKSSGSPKSRGRKRRAVLRRFRTGAKLANVNGTENDVLNAKKPEATSAIPNRGRLKRRERRKNGFRRKESMPDISPEADKNTISRASRHNSQTLQSSRSQTWRFNHGEIGLEEQNNKIPVLLSFTFDHAQDNTTLKSLDHSELTRSEESHSTVPEAFMPHSNPVPELIVRPLDGSGEDTSPTRYHIISYRNQDADLNGILDLPRELVVDSRVGDKYDEQEIPLPKDYQIHIADLVDTVGVVKSNSWRANIFFSAIEADPSSLTDPDGPAILSGRSGSDKGHYWHKFAVLLHGFTHAEERRDLPYSLGYGVDHNNPVMVSRDNRWAYFDIDTITRHSKRPRWRAAWRFETSPVSDKCECSLNKIVHDLNTCKHLYKEEALARENVWRSRHLSDEILSDLGTYAHKPYEHLRDLEKTLHVYYPPYVPIAEDESSSSSSSTVKTSSGSSAAANTEGTEKKAADDSSLDLPESSENADNSDVQRAADEDLKDSADKGTIERAEAEKKRQQSKEADRTYELGICSFMALGVPKDVSKGIALIAKSAELGCFKARATIHAIASAYGVDLDTPSETLRTWLYETGSTGSRLALRSLSSLFPDIYQDCLALRQDTLDYQIPKTISCADDILPHFDLRDSNRLRTQIAEFEEDKSEDTRQASDQGSGSKRASLFVMARMSEQRESQYEPTTYFAFGSLLHLAATFGYKDAVVALLDVGFDVNAQSALRAIRTPLLCAMNRGHADIANLLVDRGADCRPLSLWAFNDMFCTTPTALHYLVNIENVSRMKQLARLLVKNGADVNYKCSIDNLKLQTPTEIPILKGRSVTPLRWAAIHRKPQVVRVLLSLGARFAYVEYFRPSLQDQPENKDLQKGCLLLETPCTDLDILEMFYARARVPGLPIEFSQTPLGLLVSEDDGPERRLRPGFGDFDSIREALDLCLELQPGYEEVLMWSAVRHDHIDIVKYLLEDLEWSVESRWRGLTSLQTAILYGRTRLVQYLLAGGADTTAKTTSRQLTCLHLLMLLPRHPQVDQDIFNSISMRNIEVNARETIDGITAFHLAVRNQKLPMVRHLIDLGADPLVPVTDQLSLLSQGKGGYLEHTPDRPQIFSEDLTILGEVILQYNQDNFYDMPYVADLLFLLLDRLPAPLTEEVLTIDKGISLTLLHVLSILPPHSGVPHVYRRDAPQTRWNEPPPIIPPPPTAPASLLQLVLLRSSPSAINARDFQGDTPLHYACAAHQLHHIRTLLAAGADPTIRNNVGLIPVEAMAWSVIFLSSKTLLLHEPRRSWHPELEFSPGFDGKTYKRGKHPASNLSIAFSIFADLGLNVDERLKRLVLAWDFAKVGDDEDMNHGSGTRRLEFVPVKSARGIVGDEDPDSRIDEDGKYVDWDKKIKRPYTLVSVKGPNKWKTQYGTDEWDRQWEIDFERANL